MKKDNILRPVSFLCLITAITAFINFIYNIIMSRMLKVSDFGDLRALLSIVMMVAVPVSTIRTMMAKFTAEYYHTDLGKLKSLIRHTLVFILALGLVFIAVFGFFHHPIAGYLKISSANLVLLLGPLMLIALIQPGILGIYQGLQHFLLLGVNSLATTILKLILGVFFVYLGYATWGALFGLLLGGVIIISVFALMLLTVFKKNKSPKDYYNRQDIYSYSGYALGVLVCFSIVSQIDILIVKHKFLPQQAGFYACAAVIGKGFLFLPAPVATVLFPKVVANNKIGKSGLPLLIQSLAITLLLCLAGAIVCFFLPHYLIKIFGSKYAEAAHLIKIFGLAMIPLALFYVLMNYFLSEYRLRFFYYCLCVCAGGIIILFSLPRTLEQFLIVQGWYGLLIFLIHLVYILVKEKRIV